MICDSCTLRDCLRSQSGSNAEMAAYFVQEAWCDIDSSIYSILDRVSKLKYALNVNESFLL